MNKDFKKWHDKKARLHNQSSRVFFHEREVWWCSLGLNVGFEQDGKGFNFARPVLIFKKFNNETFWAIPLTTKVKTGRYWFPVDLKDGTKRTAVLSQVRLVDAKRLYQKMGVLDEAHYQKLNETFIKLCETSG